MAYVCYDCRIIFPSKKANCPFCGGRIYFDEKSDSVLQSDGFTSSNMKTRHNNNTTHSSNDFRIDDSNILSSLRQSYNTEHRSMEQGSDGTPQRTTHVSSQTSISTAQHQRTQVDTPTSDEDFFSQFQESTVPNTSIPTVDRPSENNLQPNQSMSDGSEYELQSIQRQQRRIRNNYRRLAIMNFFSTISWRTVFRIILLIAVLLGIWTIWKLRYVILNSIMDFFIALIPLIIIIWIIVLIFKSFFK